MKIKGIVKQIISPEEIEKGDYILYNLEVFEKGQYLVYIEDKEFANTSFFNKLMKRFRFNSKTEQEIYAWSVIFDKINFKEGDMIEVEIIPFQTFSGYFKKEGEKQ